MKLNTLTVSFVMIFTLLLSSSANEVVYSFRLTSAGTNPPHDSPGIAEGTLAVIEPNVLLLDMSYVDLSSPITQINVGFNYGNGAGISVEFVQGHPQPSGHWRSTLLFPTELFHGVGAVNVSTTDYPFGWHGEIGGPLVAVPEPDRYEVVAIPDNGLEQSIRWTLGRFANPLTVDDMLSLTSLDASGKGITSISGLEFARNLRSINLRENRLATLDFPPRFRRLISLDVGENQLTEVKLPTDLSSLQTLKLDSNRLTAVSVSRYWENLATIDFQSNQLAVLEIPTTLRKLAIVDARNNALVNLQLFSGLQNLRELHLTGNPLTNLDIAPGLNRLTSLNLDGRLGARLSSLTLGHTLSSLTNLDLRNNRLASLVLPAGMTSLSTVFLDNNELTNFIVVGDVDALKILSLEENPLRTLILPAGNHVVWETFLHFTGQGSQVTLLPTLRSPKWTQTGEFSFDIFSAPGVVVVLRTSDFNTWTEIRRIQVLETKFEGLNFTDHEATLEGGVFYRVGYEAPKSPGAN